MPTDKIELFKKLSATLTGIHVASLSAESNQNHIHLYFNAARSSDPLTFERLLDIYAANMELSKSAIAEVLLNQSGEAVCFLARAIILSWYLDHWYRPADLRVAAGAI